MIFIVWTLSDQKMTLYDMHMLRNMFIGCKMMLQVTCFYGFLAFPTLSAFVTRFILDKLLSREELNMYAFVFQERYSFELNSIRDDSFLSLWRRKTGYRDIINITSFVHDPLTTIGTEEVVFKTPVKN